MAGLQEPAPAKAGVGTVDSRPRLREGDVLSRERGVGADSTGWKDFAVVLQTLQSSCPEGRSERSSTVRGRFASGLRSLAPGQAFQDFCHPGAVRVAVVQADLEVVVALPLQFSHLSTLGSQGVQHGNMVLPQVGEVVLADFQQKGRGVAHHVVHRAGRMNVLR